MNIPILRIPYTENDLDFIKKGIEEVLRSGQLTLGKNVAKFEERFAKFIGTDYAIGINSGTSALEIFLRSIDVRESSVIVPTNTFMATATSVIHAGGGVVFTDIQHDNLCMDPDDLQEKIRKDTKAVIVVHIGGIITSHIKVIQQICDDHDIYLLEDVAHAHGSEIDGIKAGALGDAGAFSFYPTKIMTCCEGGMLTTNDKEIFEKALVLRDHGKADHRFNIHTEFGYNWRLSEIHAVLGLEQMNKVDWILSERRRIAAIYNKKLKTVKGIELVTIPENIKSSYYKYIVYLEEGIERDYVKNKMKSDYTISLPGEVYADPCHSQPVFKNYANTMLNKWTDTFPNAEYICRHHICLPLYPGLTDQEIGYVVKSLKEVLQ